MAIASGAPDEDLMSQIYGPIPALRQAEHLFVSLLQHAFSG
jgi:hypothetical protein